MLPGFVCHRYPHFRHSHSVFVAMLTSRPKRLILRLDNRASTSSSDSFFPFMLLPDVEGALGAGDGDIKSALVILL